MKTIIKNCRECGKTFSIDENMQKKLKDLKLDLPARCHKCREKKRIVHTVKQCRDCKETFVISQLDAEWYENKGYVLPGRCPACRMKRRKEAAKA